MRARLADGEPWQKVAIVVTALVALVLVVAIGRKLLTDDDVKGASAGAGTNASVTTVGKGGSGDNGGRVGTGASGANGGTGVDGVPTQAGVGPYGTTPTTLISDPVIPNDVVPPVDLPNKAKASNTTGLADGDVVTVAIDADKDSQIFAAQARLCAGGATVESDYDMRPSLGGKCIPFPLSPNSDAFVDARNAAPYQHMELKFRVGTGTSTYTTQDGEPVSITCGHDHPCTLAVKFQVPNGFGFRTYPLEYR